MRAEEEKTRTTGPGIWETTKIPVRGDKTYQCRTSTENKRKRKTALLCAYVQAARLLVGAARLGSADDCAIDV